MEGTVSFVSRNTDPRISFTYWILPKVFNKKRRLYDLLRYRFY